MPIFGLVCYSTRGRSHACHQQLKGSVARQVECQGVATASSLDDKCSAEVIISWYDSLPESKQALGSSIFYICEKKTSE